MILDDGQMKRQTTFELSLSYINRLHRDGLLTDGEYRETVLGIERKYRPVVRHIPLLEKE